MLARIVPGFGGRQAGSEAAIALGFEANANPPKLRVFDRFGRRIDDVEFHPSYHALMTAPRSGNTGARGPSRPPG